MSNATQEGAPVKPGRARDEGRVKRQALDGKRGNVFHVAPEALTVVVDPEHFLYDPRAMEFPPPELLASIDQEGVRVPLFAWKEGEDTLVVAGRKRTLGARLVNERRRAEGREPLTVPVIVLPKSTDQRSLVAIMILENEARVEETPTGKARKTERYLALLGGVTPENKASAAAVFGVTVKTVEARLKLLGLAPPVRQAVEDGRIGFWAATELHGQDEGAQVEQLAALETEAAEAGRRPTIEGAKRKAGKGKSPAREKLEKARKRLLDAAERFGSARMDEFGIREARSDLEDAALAYYKLAKKEE